MDNISAARTEELRLRLSFVKEIESKLDLFCQLATAHHPDELPCEPFKPIGHDKHIKYGSFNLCVFIQFTAPSTQKWVIRVPFPHRSFWILERLRSEVATMAFMATAQEYIPVPKIHAYSLNSDNLIKSPFIITNYCEGRPLHELGFQKGGRSPDYIIKKVYNQLALFQCHLRRLEFPKIGALSLPSYTNQPPTESEINGITVQNRPLSINIAMQHEKGYQPEEIIQPGMTFSTTGEFITTLKRLSDNQFLKSPDVGLDVRGGRSLIYANHDIYRFIRDEWIHSDGPFVLTHGDITLHDNNILFDSEFNLVAVIDWEWSFVAPVQFLVPPAWLTGAGFGFMIQDLGWYDKEAEEFLRQVRYAEDELKRQSLPPRIWTGACDTATVVALLHPDHIYESYWTVIHGEQHGVSPIKDIRKFLSCFINDSPKRQILLVQKWQEQILFWVDEMKFLEKKERPFLIDGEPPSLLQSIGLE
ncbi:hypothetical protein M441DRAFT_142394 [Trichoderma asperellum CBS 433.97]|uniref:Aminoglycoside phosphotransferase domain-containing protein n=1 Tax=Trichoderma asperellum (strain ATCC 204424 / CBS 433.97 / NBRC 101777) TaxID=1042311 RepID=A0A2T3Z6D0_TRIA4|nr:hypothetical protein M441DRAFT_142394 [Trichoderma asperellum CBS 433.97]PTB40354.1 hypothetical protein M441DRAFT_142394 [Trichoderma asperellum CBS 433.97]